MRRPHSGQASVMLLALVASLVTAFAVSFGAGQLVNDKMRLVNAADAAAYSAAQWEARSLNFQSYLNRAIVANEVAIAQLVSLRSWSSYVATLTRNGATVARWIPPLAGPVQALERGWNAVDSFETDHLGNGARVHPLQHVQALALATHEDAIDDAVGLLVAQRLGQHLADVVFRTDLDVGLPVHRQHGR